MISKEEDAEIFLKILNGYQGHLKAIWIIHKEEKIVLDGIKSGAISEADDAANLSAKR